MGSCKKVGENVDAIRRNYENELERTRNEFEEEMRMLKVELAKINNLNHQQKLKLGEQESRYRSCAT
jgi:hypothetical protein